jgi:hypothetical protein
MREEDLDVACSTHARKKKYRSKTFVRNPVGNKTLGGHFHRWKDNINIYCDM